MEASHEMLLAGLRRKIGPDGDLQWAYREWYERHQALKWAPESWEKGDRPMQIRGAESIAENDSSAT
jgi:hypothetical protein